MNPTPERNSQVKSAGKLQLMERVGGKLFLHWTDKHPIDHTEEGVHILDPREQGELRRVEFRAIFRAAIIGVISALFCAFSWPAAVGLLGQPEGDVSWWGNWKHYAVMFGVISIGTVIEIILLYWNALHAVHCLSRVAGLRLFDQDRQPFAVTSSLIQAALELPYTREETNGAIPGREVSRWWVLVVTILYRLKVTFTYYLSKVLVQRLMGRVLVRWVIELVAIPIYAFWDSLVTYFVVRKARVNAMGPSMVHEAIEKMGIDTLTLDDRSKEIVLCAIGCTVARNANLHPNVAYLLEVLYQRFGLDTEINIDESQRLMSLLSVASYEQKRLAVQILSLSLVIDGKISLWERRLLDQALEQCGFPSNRLALRRALKSFCRGSSMQIDSFA